VIAPPAPFPFLRPGNQKASKQVRSHVQPKCKKPNQNFTATSAHAVLWIRTTKTCIASAKTVCKTAGAASSTTTTTTTNTSNATTPRAATSSCSASGESPFQTKPSPLPPQRKAKSWKLTAQKTSSAERRNGAKSSISSSSPQRHRKQSARAFFGQEQKKNWPRVLNRLHVLSRACLSEQADIMSSRCLLEQRDPQRKERRVFFGKSRSSWVL
jgi:hypothetical protein